MPSVPPISVVMAVYNTASFIEEAVGSLLSQTFTDIEIIVLDDGSTDDSLTILKTIEAKDCRLRVFSLEHTGLIGAVNFGLMQARGEYIARMDSDDIAEPTRLAKQVAFLDAHPDVVGVGTAVVLIDPEGELICPARASTGHDEIRRRLLNGEGEAISQPSSMLRKSAVLAIGGYRVGFAGADDLDFFLRLSEQGSLANLPEPLHRYRQHISSIGHSRRWQQTESCRRAVAEALARQSSVSLSSAPGDIQLDTSVDPSMLEPSVPVPLSHAHRTWAMLAAAAGNMRVARKHAFRAWKMEPWSIVNYVVLAAVLMGASVSRLSEMAATQSRGQSLSHLR